MTTKNPCKNNKCLLYPICINKKSLPYCEKLSQYITSHINLNSKRGLFLLTHKERCNLWKKERYNLWKTIHKILPNTNEFIISEAGITIRYRYIDCFDDELGVIAE